MVRKEQGEIMGLFGEMCRMILTIRNFHCNYNRNSTWDGILGVQNIVITKLKEQFMEESIYNIIPKQRPWTAKEPRYQSKYPPNVPPSYSTFNVGTTSKPGVSNPAGELYEAPLPHTPYGEAKTLGYLKGQRRPVPDNFRLKQTGTMGSNELPQKQQFSYNCSHRKTPIPHDKPIHGLRSAKNFIVSNAVQNILSVPKMEIAPVDWTKKKDFGKVPKYITKIKEDVQNQNRMRERFRRESSDERYCLSLEEVKALQAELTRKWNEVHKEYQGITHKGKVDTLGLKRKKEDCEKQLNDIEADMKKLERIHKFLIQ